VPKSAGLSQIFRPGSERIDGPTHFASPAPVSPALGGEPAAGAAPQGTSGTSASEAGTSIEQDPLSPSGEPKADGRTHEGDKKKERPLSPIFRRGKPNA